MGVYFGVGITVYDYSAMQGPCATGFHVPLKSEMETLKSTGVSLGAWTNSGGANFSSYLKMPLCGQRAYDSNVYSANTDGNYWTSSNASSTDAYGIFMASSYLDITQFYKIQGASVRPFKDEPVIPDSSWAKTYSGIGDAGIYRSSTLGLISISADGNTWITIADKNLGATTVWSSGNPTAANGGKFYQRGNNYGFAIRGAITTTTTKPNTNGYGPGNYYSGSSFVKASSWGNWSSVNNTDLRGGTTGVQPKTVYPELKNAYIGGTPIKRIFIGANLVRGPALNFATQGPCPDGFHVPLKSDRNTLTSTLSALSVSASGSNFKTYLKMPPAGQRVFNGATTVNQGNYGYYWSSSNDGRKAANMFFYNEYAGTSNDVRANASSIRPFKDAPVIPDSSWAVLKQGTGTAGIYHNSTLGLISISSDGTTWITIADKNLGATTVYNSGNTLNQNNCGKYYQWGNNYGFPYSGSVTTASGWTDASNYGPGNYYSSSTFYQGSGGYYEWDSSNNTNLRGGVDGNVPV